jgi:predicted nucleic acid-binding protein
LSGYFDTAYIAKCYINERDSGRVRRLLRRLGGAHSSSLCRAEMASIFLRHEREGSLDREQATKLRTDFEADLDAGVWTLLPLSDALIARVAARIGALAPNTYVRALDAIHLCSADESGFREVWTNDRHMLAAAPAFRLKGRSL